MPNELKTSSQLIAAEIRAEMARQKVSVNTLAEKVAMPISTLRRSVNGDRPLTLDEFWAVTQQLQVDPAALVAETARGAA